MKLIDYYEKLGITEATLISLNQELSLPYFASFSDLTNKQHSTRLESLNEIKSDKWSYNLNMTGSEIESELKKSIEQWKRPITIIYESGDYKIGFARPGKEAATDYTLINHYSHCTGDCCKDGRTTKTNNPPDVFPLIMKDKEIISVRKRSFKSVRKPLNVVGWTFERVFKGFEINGHIDPNNSKSLLGMEILGSLLFRSAFMLDHSKDSHNSWRVNYPRNSLSELKSRIPYLPVEDFLYYGGQTRTHKVPIDVMLYFLDILSINEDVKVDTKGYKDLRSKTSNVDNGRTNTHLTYCNLIATILGRVAIGDFSYQFQRKAGMADLSKSKGENIFPLLSRDLKSTLNKDITQLDWFRKY